MTGRFDNIHPGLTCEHARAILLSPLQELEAQSDLYMAAAHLINCPGKATEKSLIQLLELQGDEQPIQIAKRKAVEVLGRLNCVSSVLAIGKCLWSDDKYLVENTVWSLQLLKCDEPALISQMLELLDDESQNQRILIQCLAALKVRKSFNAIQKLQFSASSGVSGAAIAAVSQMSGDLKCMRRLVDYLALPNQMDRQCAVQDLIDAKGSDYLEDIITAPVSPSFRMRACRNLLHSDDNSPLTMEKLCFIDRVLDDDPGLINVVHQYDKEPSPEFLIRDLFNTDFSRCYLALNALQSFNSEHIFTLLQAEWEEEAYNDYGAHYLFIRLFGLHSGWSALAMNHIRTILGFEIRNQRPQFQKSRAAAINVYARLFPDSFLASMPAFLDPSVSPPWDCRYVTIMVVDRMQGVSNSHKANLLQPFLDDEDVFVAARARAACF